MTNTFAQRLTLARQRRGLSQAKLACLAGQWQPSFISHLEAGDRNPSYTTFTALAEVLDVSADYLIGRAKNLDGNTEGPLKNVSELTLDDLTIVQGVINQLRHRS